MVKSIRSNELLGKVYTKKLSPLNRIFFQFVCWLFDVAFRNKIKLAAIFFLIIEVTQYFSKGNLLLDNFAQLIKKDEKVYFCIICCTRASS